MILLSSGSLFTRPQFSSLCFLWTFKNCLCSPFFPGKLNSTASQGTQNPNPCSLLQSHPCITFGSGWLLMEAVLCLELLVLRWGRMSYGLEEGVTWGQFRLLNNGNTCRLPNSLPRKQNWVLIFFWRQCNSVLRTWIWANSRKSEGQGSLVYCSPWGHKEWDTT